MAKIAIGMAERMASGRPEALDNQRRLGLLRRVVLSDEFLALVRDEIERAMNE